LSFVSALIQPGQWPYVAPIILLSWTQAAGFALIALGAALVFHGQT